MKIITGYNKTLCVIDEETNKVLNVSHNIDELITYLKSQKQKKEQEIKLIQEHIRFFDIQR